MLDCEFAFSRVFLRISIGLVLGHMYVPWT